MKKLSVLLLLVIAVFGMATVADAKKKTRTVKVRSTVTLNCSRGTDPSGQDPYGQNPYGQNPGQGVCKGRVRPGKKKGQRVANICRRNRKVRVRQVSGGVVGEPRTNKKGRYSVALPSSAPSGDYIAKARRKVVKKNIRINGKKRNTKIICRSAQSGSVTVP